MKSVDARDLAFAQTFAVAPVPRFGAFEPLAEPGQRLLVAANGMFLEVRRAWLHAIQPCAQPIGRVCYPFGAIEARTAVAFEPSELGRQAERFLQGAARAHYPQEVAAVMIYTEGCRTLKLRECESGCASAAAVRYRLPRLCSDEHIVADIHSHGAMAAFFSAQDDADDTGAVRFAMVVGRLDLVRPHIDLRLCLNGLFVPIEQVAWLHSEAAEFRGLQVVHL